MTVGFLCVTFASASAISSPVATLRTSLGSMTSRPRWSAATVSAVRIPRVNHSATHRLRTLATAVVTVAAATVVAAVAAAKHLVKDPRISPRVFFVAMGEKNWYNKINYGLIGFEMYGSIYQRSRHSRI